MNPRISVAMCTCNGAAYIAEQIESICGQTLLPDEIVVRDDLSDDDTVAVLWATWKNRAGGQNGGKPTLRVQVNERRLGVAKNFESAIHACLGDVIVLCDQDDRWHANRVERALAIFARHPQVLLVHGDARLIDACGQGTGKTLFGGLQVTSAELTALQQGRALDVLLDRNLVTGATTAFRRELLQTAFPFPGNWLHDEWLGVLAAAHEGLFVEPDALVDYRQHASNQIGARQESWFSGLRRAFTMNAGEQGYRAVRSEQLQARLRASPQMISPEALFSVSAKVRHHRLRAGLPPHRLLRLPAVLREWMSGGYDRFGRGWRGAVKDLLEGR